MARRRRLTPAQPGYLAPVPDGAPLEARAAPIAQVSGQSAEAAALREMAHGLQAARDQGRMVVEVPLGDIAPEYLLRDRMALDRGALDELKASIRAHGQRTPAEITPIPRDAPGADGEGTQPFALISGWRRLSALAELQAETGEARFATLRALIRPLEETPQSYVAMVEENEIRVGLSYYERARLVAEVTARGVYADQSAALRDLFAAASRAKRSKIASFIDIHEGLGDVLGFPSEIPERLGLALVSRLRMGERLRLRREITAAAPTTAEAELALLERLAARPKAKAGGVSRAKHPAETLRPGLAMTVDRKGDRISVTLSGKQVTEEMLSRLRAMLREEDAG